MAHPGATVAAEDHRARAYWKYHKLGVHKVPAGGARPDHFFACAWCRPGVSDDREWEQFLCTPDADLLDVVRSVVR